MLLEKVRMDLGTVLMVVGEDCSCLNLSVTLQQLSHGDELVQNKNHFLRSRNQREGMLNTNPTFRYKKAMYRISNVC